MARILVIDDDRIILRIMEKTLTKLNYEVILANDGKEGLNLVKTERPDLIVTDKSMPVIDGYEVTRRVRREPEFSHIPILVLTSENLLEDKVNAFEAGADDYMSKPFEMAELTARLAALLRRAEALKTAKQQQRLKTAETAHFIAVHTLRGGSGASSLAVNLALGLANLWQNPTLLLDLALLSGEVALMLNKPLKSTWGNLAGYTPEEIDVEALQTVVSKYDDSLFYIAAPPNPANAEQIDPHLFGRAATLLQPYFHYIVADLAHDFGVMTLDALDHADALVLVVTPDIVGVRAAAIALDTYRQLNHDMDKVWLALNHPFAQGALPTKQIEAALKRPIDLMIPFSDDLFVEALNRGTPLLRQHPKATAAMMIEDFAYAISKKQHRSAPPASPSSTWRRVQRRQKGESQSEKQKKLLPFM